MEGLDAVAGVKCKNRMWPCASCRCVLRLPQDAVPCRCQRRGHQVVAEREVVDAVQEYNEVALRGTL